MRIKRLIVICLVTASMVQAEPALADESYAVTPSGTTEAIFDMPVVQASDHLANSCLDLGWTMIESTNTIVVCEAPMNFGQSLLATLAMGNSYSTPPRMFFRFNLAGLGSSTRAQVSAWTELQMAFGQTRRTELASDKYHNDAMSFLGGIGGRFPPGTTFPNHALAGFRFESVESPRDGLRVLEVAEGSAAEEAGLALDDVVTRVAGERTKNQNDLLDGLHKAISNPTYEVEFYRSGERMEAVFPTRFRLAEIAPPRQDDADEPEVEVAPVNAIARFSVAEEIARFAELRDSGIISEDEFQTQKKRLLEQ